MLRKRLITLNYVHGVDRNDKRAFLFDRFCSRHFNMTSETRGRLELKLHNDEWQTIVEADPLQNNDVITHNIDPFTPKQ